MLKLLLTGNAQQAEHKLKLQFLAWRCGQPTGAMPATPRRKVADLHKLAASAAKARKKQAAVQRKKAEAGRQAKRETYVRTLATDFNRCWRTADKRAERDQIVAICMLGNTAQSIPVLDLPMPAPLPEGVEWIAAYHRWCGS